MSGFTAVGLFVVSLVFSLLIFSLWLRIALKYFRISTLNPLSQLVYTLTNPMVAPAQILFKNSTKAGQKYEPAVIATLILVEIIKIALISLIAFGGLMHIGYFILYVVADLVIQPCDLMFFAILIRVIMSFVNPAWNGPIADVLYIITEPALIVGRKIIPNISGFDFSPFIMLMILKVITLFVSANLPWRLL